MLFVVPVGAFSLALAFLIAVVVGSVIWAAVLSIGMLFITAQLCRPSVRREIMKGWKGLPPYDQ